MIEVDGDHYCDDYGNRTQQILCVSVLMLSHSLVFFRDHSDVIRWSEEFPVSRVDRYFPGSRRLNLNLRDRVGECSDENSVAFFEGLNFPTFPTNCHAVSLQHSTPNRLAIGGRIWRLHELLHDHFCADQFFPFRLSVEDVHVRDLCNRVSPPVHANTSHPCTRGVFPRRLD